MLVIGLTGGIGSGKTEVSNLFRKLHIDVIDADVLAREVVVPGSYGLEKIVDHFGVEILNEEGVLDRRKLREIIFHDQEEKIWLEGLLHPLIHQEMLKKITESTSSYIILVSPLLLETSQFNLVDRVLVVDAPEETQIQRTQERDQQSRDDVRAIMANQLSRLERLAKADDILINDSDLEKLAQEVEQLHQYYLTLSKENENDLNKTRD